MAKRKAARARVKRLNQKDAAAALGIKSSTLRGWQKEPGFPDYRNGYDVAAIMVWREEYDRKGSKQAVGAQQIKMLLASEKVKQLRIDTERKALLLEREKGELFRRVGAERAVATVLTEVNQLFTGIIETFPPRCGVPEEFQDELRRRLTKELNAGRVQMRNAIDAEMNRLDEDQRSKS